MKNVSLAAVASNVSRSCPLTLDPLLKSAEIRKIRQIERAGEESLSGNPERERERERGGGVPDSRPSAF
jgi:hypothetical protein